MYPPWNPGELTVNDLNGNKLVTSVYRFMRLFGAYGLYLQRAAALPRHRNPDRLKWIMEKKIHPLLASGKMFSEIVILRDMMMELSDAMLDKSTKWDAVTVIGFSDWISRCKNDPVVQFNAGRLALLFSTPSSRLALLGIYLIDMRQDLIPSLEHENIRSELLLWLRDRADSKHLSIWGLTDTGQTDLEAMDVSTGKIPRDFRSPHYDSEANRMGYMFKRASRS
jgi:hypothetical protein